MRSPVVEDLSAPATKQDIGLLMERMGSFEDRMGSFEDRMGSFEGRMNTFEAFVKAEGEKTRQHFDVVAENLHYDLVGIYKDRTEDHEQRIRRLERKTGLAA